MNLVHDYTPLGACKDLIESREPQVLVSGPAGTGKSRACLEKLHLSALLNPGMRGLILRKTQTSLTTSALVTWKRDVIPESREAGLVGFYGGSAEEPAQYRYSNGSVIVIGGMDKASKVLSTEYDLIYVQEAIELSEDDWETLTTRLRSEVISYQQLLADCNPAEDTHWLKQRCDQGRTKLLHSRHEDNPTLFIDGEMTTRGKRYIKSLDALTGVRYRRLRLGEWSSAEGVVYEEWDSAVHLIDPFPIPDSWVRYWSVDFGYTNPFVCQWWAEDHDGRLYLYRELYQTQRLVEDHAETMLKVSEDEPHPTAIVCDHDAEGRATLRKKLGLSTTGARKAVIDGIQAVQSRLKVQDDGKPRLFIMRGALISPDPELIDAKRPLCTEQEIPGYVWDISENKPPKETPVKKDDHGCDAMRYMVMHLERGKASTGMSQVTSARI